MMPPPETVQVTAVFAVPVTPAVNCCCPLVAIVAEIGEIVTPTVAVVPIVTLALPNCVKSNREVAITVTTGGFGAVAGAVYNPLPVIIPQETPLQPAVEMLQRMTLEPIALNCT
jgi:hypothetical protein